MISFQCSGQQSVFFLNTFRKICNQELFSCFFFNISYYGRSWLTRPINDRKSHSTNLKGLLKRKTNNKEIFLTARQEASDWAEVANGNGTQLAVVLQCWVPELEFRGVGVPVGFQGSLYSARYWPIRGAQNKGSRKKAKNEHPNDMKLCWSYMLCWPFRGMRWHT